MCAHACQLVGASLWAASITSSSSSTKIARAVPDAVIEGLLRCLRVAPARAKAARALFYASKVIRTGGDGGGGGGGALIEAKGGVQVHNLMTTWREIVGVGPHALRGVHASQRMCACDGRKIPVAVPPRRTFVFLHGMKETLNSALLYMYPGAGMFDPNSGAGPTIILLSSGHLLCNLVYTLGNYSHL